MFRAAPIGEKLFRRPALDWTSPGLPIYDDEPIATNLASRQVVRRCWVRSSSRMEPSTILVVEDNEDDAFFIRRVLEQAGIANPVRLVDDGRQAIDYLSGSKLFADRERFPLPMLVFLDLGLPRKSGHQVLGWLRQQPQFAKLIVIVLTSSAAPIDLNRAYRAGANSYMVKPPTSEQLKGIARYLDLGWLCEADCDIR